MTESFTMGWPQMSLILLYAASFGFCVAKNGEPKEGKISVGLGLFEASLVLGICYWGGFFS